MHAPISFIYLSFEPLSTRLLWCFDWCMLVVNQKEAEQREAGLSAGLTNGDAEDEEVRHVCFLPCLFTLFVVDIIMHFSSPCYPRPYS